MGRRGNFYCLFHRHPENRKPGLIQDEHFRVYSDPACVRDWIEINYDRRPQADVERMLREHDEWHRQEHETKSDYQRRMRAVCDTLFGSVKRLETG